MALKVNCQTVKTIDPATVNASSGERERESISSKLNHNEQAAISDGSSNSKDSKRKKKKDKKKMTKDSIRDLKDKQNIHVPVSDENSVTDIQENEAGPKGTELKGAVIEIDNCNTKLSESFANNNNTSANLKKSTVVYQFIEEKQKISLSKERRAARTLGIIMDYVGYKFEQLQRKLRKQRSEFKGEME